MYVDFYKQLQNHISVMSMFFFTIKVLSYLTWEYLKTNMKE